MKERYQILENFANKNIFQISIDLRDDLKPLLDARKSLIKKNPGWNYYLIKTKKDLDDFMLDNFGESSNDFEKSIYDAYLKIPNIIGYNEKAMATSGEEREEVHRVCGLVAQTDIFRTAAVYKFGGVYCDLSSYLSLDLNKYFACRDATFFECGKELRSSVFFAKKSDAFIKGLLKMQVKNCLEPRSANQMQIAGPACFTIFAKFVWPGKNGHNLKIYNEHPFKDIGWKMVADWKKDLHTKDPKNPNKKVNTHWLCKY